MSPETDIYQGARKEVIKMTHKNGEWSQYLGLQTLNTLAWDIKKAICNLHPKKLFQMQPNIISEFQNSHDHNDRISIFTREANPANTWHTDYAHNPNQLLYAVYMYSQSESKRREMYICKHIYLWSTLPTPQGLFKMPILPSEEVFSKGQLAWGSRVTIYHIILFPSFQSLCLWMIKAHTKILIPNNIARMSLDISHYACDIVLHVAILHSYIDRAMQHQLFQEPISPQPNLHKKWVMIKEDMRSDHLKTRSRGHFWKSQRKATPYSKTYFHNSRGF